MRQTFAHTVTGVDRRLPQPSTVRQPASVTSAGHCVSLLQGKCKLDCHCCHQSMTASQKTIRCDDFRRQYYPVMSRDISLNAIPLSRMVNTDSLAWKMEKSQQRFIETFAKINENAVYKAKIEFLPFNELGSQYLL